MKEIKIKQKEHNSKRKGINLIKKSASKIIKKSIKFFVIIQPHENELPLFYFDHLFSGYSKDCGVSKKERQNKRNYADSIYRKREDINDLIIFDLLNISCKDNQCRHLEEGKYLYRDDDHISNYASSEYFTISSDTLRKKIR